MNLKLSWRCSLGKIIQNLKFIKTHHYKNVHEVTTKSNKERIEALEDRNKWLARTMIGAILCEVVGLGFMLMQIGLGAN